MDAMQLLDFFDVNHNVLCDVRPQTAPQEEIPTAWIFGYGSLCYYPGFEFEKCVLGYIRGYSRKFWQGNTTHRGVPGKPGVVATLIEEKEGITWGCAYKITGSLALEYLKQRECTLGGYVTEMTKFYPRNNGDAFPALLYIATPVNEHWIGELPEQKLAEMIVDSRGPSGHNVEYLIRLVIFMREELPGMEDEHLFKLDKFVRQYLLERKMSLSECMGPPKPPIRRDMNANDVPARPTTFEHTSRVPSRRLRCLNI
ncbi:putative glutathione-specific gamma-glutamylcyclotransferase 2 [Culicoides brevitarsis]|uniref:putative glutathione-specific gamma-glutamylcyclotransferase 2 n=1 Tax=Culicoides brevitarsis TaxID=469753 RepID=UPI00307B1277